MQRVYGLCYQEVLGVRTVQAILMWKNAYMHNFSHDNVYERRIQGVDEGRTLPIAYWRSFLALNQRREDRERKERDGEDGEGREQGWMAGGGAAL